MICFLFSFPVCEGDTVFHNDCGTICGEQCVNYVGSGKCTPGVRYPCDHARCICKSGHAYIEKGKCAPIDSAECGGKAAPK